MNRQNIHANYLLKPHFRVAADSLKLANYYLYKNKLHFLHFLHFLHPNLEAQEPPVVRKEAPVIRKEAPLTKSEPFA